MPVKDSFDPTMMLGSAKNVGEPAGAEIPADREVFPADVLKLDGTQNLGDATRNVEMPGAENPVSTDGIQRQAGLVDSFDGTGGL